MEQSSIATIEICDTSLPVREYHGRRVITFRDIDCVHQRVSGTARKRFNDNRKHFIEGTDFFIVNQPSEICTLGITRPQGGTPDSVVLVTESGYLLLVKSFTDDLAWTVQRQLVNVYFRSTPEQRADAAKQTIEQMIPQDYISALRALADSLEQKEILEKEKLALESENRIMQPKADYFDDLVNRNTLTGIRETAKEFRVPQNKFVSFLMDNGYVYRTSGKLMPYAGAVKDGLFQVKERKSGINGWSGTQIFVTPKGRETFRLLLKHTH